MISDILTIIWKEWKELFMQRGGFRGGPVGILVFVAVFGVVLPLQMGPAWLNSPALLIYWAWVPLFLVTNVIADAIAGERERHTLETLLASRLSDRAILFGKVGAAVGYAWGLTMISLLLGAVAVNVAHPADGLRFYPALVAVAAVLLSLLMSGLAAAVGILVSLRASTVRQAQQTLSVVVMLLLFVPIFGIQALPQSVQVRIFAALQGVNVTTALAVALLVLLVLTLALLAAAMARFQRARLILD